MIKALYRRLNHCNDLAVRISKANTAHLQQLKAELAELIGTPTGCYTMGIPAVFYKMLLFTLHNRALRKLLHQTRKT